MEASLCVFLLMLAGGSAVRPGIGVAVAHPDEQAFTRDFEPDQVVGYGTLRPLRSRVSTRMIARSSPSAAISGRSAVITIFTGAPVVPGSISAHS